MRFALAPLLALATLSSAANAQYEARSGSVAELREYTREYARCMVLYQHVEARGLVLSNTPNDRLEREFASIYTTKPLAKVMGCDRLVIRDGHAFILQPDLLRGALAQELVIADLKVAEVDNFASRARLSHWLPGSLADYAAKRPLQPGPARHITIEQAYAEEMGRAWLSRYGECIVRSNSAASYSWITTKPGTPAEKAAMTALQATFAACLAQGETLTFGKAVLQGAVAINYYRLAMASPVPANGVAK
ncbi:hypothetical protein [Novosphingobium sp.]|uniref:hypothetical protein n=1 Tax=Novosphingobium sp. TaxID=1874826 RepID=UPI00286AA184|nr:hypothetical protein [Novosphingobium sp.]